ncbi:MAG: 2-hydroxyacyl-CoA dehydratase family protein, partial [Dehalococcoidia bacterium]
EVRSRQVNRPEKKSARVLVYGTEIDDEAFIKLVEDCGANVVIDDICTGTKSFWHDVEITENLLDGLVERYLYKTRCARTYRESPGNYASDMENRFGYIADFARDWHATAVILYVIRFCDTVELDVPDVRDYLQGQGYPVLHIEDDYRAANMGQLRTRIQAFLETIG